MLRVERTGSIAIWTMDRPESKNALGKDLIDALFAAAHGAERDRTLRAIILTGAGGVFSAGADLREARSVVSAEDAARFSDLGESLTKAFEALPVPIIAALTGVTFGGGAELALACDMRVAEANVRFAFKQARMAVSTAWGTLPRLVSIVGHGTAMRLCTTAHEVSAMEARVLRLVDRVTDEDGDALALALAWASDIEQGSPTAVAALKSLLVASRSQDYAWLRPLERDQFIATWTSRDHQEAVAAYFERRAPTWQPLAD